MNRSEIIGFLGRDPDIKALPSGQRVANLRVATTERWKDRDSKEQREATEWHSVAVYVPFMVDSVEKHLKKGMKVFVTGALRTRKWQDQSGNDRYTTEIVVRPFNGSVEFFLPPNPNAGNSEGQGGGRREYQEEGGREAPRPRSNGRPARNDDRGGSPSWSQDSGFGDPIEEELPF